MSAPPSRTTPPNNTTKMHKGWCFLTGALPHQPAEKTSSYVSPQFNPPPIKPQDHTHRITPTGSHPQDHTHRIGALVRYTHLHPTREPGTPRPNRRAPVLSDTDGAPRRATCVFHSIALVLLPEEHRHILVEITYLDISPCVTANMQKQAGMGHIQKTILRKLEKNKYVFLTDIHGTLPQSVRRAASSLVERGLIQIWICPLKKRKAGARYQYYSVATLPGTTDEDLAALVSPA